MHRWLICVLTVAAILVLAPLAAWFGRRYGRSIKGGVALASMMMGMGALFDPPVRAAIEARREPVKDDEETGEPKDVPPRVGSSDRAPSERA